MIDMRMGAKCATLLVDLILHSYEPDFLHNNTSRKSVFPVYSIYCESVFVRWHSFYWFLQNVVNHGFLYSWFQVQQAIGNVKIVYLWIFVV